MKRRIVLEVDPSAFFDVIAAMKDGGDSAAQSIGYRIVSSILAGPDFIDRIGLAVYGIEVETEELK